MYQYHCDYYLLLRFVLGKPEEVLTVRVGSRAPWSSLQAESTYSLLAHSMELIRKFLRDLGFKASNRQILHPKSLNRFGVVRVMQDFSVSAVAHMAARACGIGPAQKQPKNLKICVYIHSICIVSTYIQT